MLLLDCVDVVVCCVMVSAHSQLTTVTTCDGVIFMPGMTHNGEVLQSVDYDISRIMIPNNRVKYGQDVCSV